MGDRQVVCGTVPGMALTLREAYLHYLGDYQTIVDLGEECPLGTVKILWDRWKHLIVPVHNTCLFLSGEGRLRGQRKEIKFEASTSFVQSLDEVANWIREYAGVVLEKVTPPTPADIQLLEETVDRMENDSTTNLKQPNLHLLGDIVDRIDRIIEDEPRMAESGETSSKKDGMKKKEEVDKVICIAKGNYKEVVTMEDFAESKEGMRNMVKHFLPDHWKEVYPGVWTDGDMGNVWIEETTMSEHEKLWAENKKKGKTFLLPDFFSLVPKPDIATTRSLLLEEDGEGMIFTAKGHYKYSDVLIREFSRLEEGMKSIVRSALPDHWVKLREGVWSDEMKGTLRIEKITRAKQDELVEDGNTVTIEDFFSLVPKPIAGDAGCDHNGEDSVRGCTRCGSDGDNPTSSTSSTYYDYVLVSKIEGGGIGVHPGLFRNLDDAVGEARRLYRGMHPDAPSDELDEHELAEPRYGAVKTWDDGSGEMVIRIFPVTEPPNYITTIEEKVAAIQGPKPKDGRPADRIIFVAKGDQHNQLQTLHEHADTEDEMIEVVKRYIPPHWLCAGRKMWTDGGSATILVEQSTTHRHFNLNECYRNIAEFVSNIPRPNPILPVLEEERSFYGLINASPIPGNNVRAHVDYVPGLYRSEKEASLAAGRDLEAGDLPWKHHTGTDGSPVTIFRFQLPTPSPPSPSSRKNPSPSPSPSSRKSPAREMNLLEDDMPEVEDDPAVTSTQGHHWMVDEDRTLEDGRAIPVTIYTCKLCGHGQEETRCLGEKELKRSMALKEQRMRREEEKKGEWVVSETRKNLCVTNVIPLKVFGSEKEALDSAKNLSDSYTRRTGSVYPIKRLLGDDETCWDHGDIKWTVRKRIKPDHLSSTTKNKKTSSAAKKRKPPPSSRRQPKRKCRGK